MVVVVGFAWSIAEFGSLNEAWLYANGVRLFIDKPIARLPDGKLGENRFAEFLVHNLSAKPIQILGARVSCGCVSTDDIFPATVPPRGIKALRLTLHVEQTPSGVVEQTLTYHTDEPTTPDLAVKVSCRVIDPGRRFLPPESRP